MSEHQKKNDIPQNTEEKESGRRKTGVIHMILFARIHWILSAPFIYIMIVPTVIFHVFLIFYQNTAFRILRIPLVSGSDHFVFDRHHLEYLNIIEKMNCLYCGYYNGVAQYAREIGGRTERYWCPIKHSRGISDPHGEYEHFFEYSDAKAYQEGRVALREFKEKE